MSTYSLNEQWIKAERSGVTQTSACSSIRRGMATSSLSSVSTPDAVQCPIEADPFMLVLIETRRHSKPPSGLPVWLGQRPSVSGRAAGSTIYGR